MSIAGADMDFGNVATGNDKKVIDPRPIREAGSVTATINDRSEMTLPDSMSEMVFMDASTLEEYRGLIDHKLYLVKLLPVLSLASKPNSSGTGRNSAANVIKFLTGSTRQKIVESVRVDRATHADIINGFKTGSAAYVRYLETLSVEKGKKASSWKTNTSLFTITGTGMTANFVPTKTFEQTLFFYILAYILYSQDCNGDAPKLDSVKEEEIDFSKASLWA
jgi:hypothetical protein